MAAYDAIFIESEEVAERTVSFHFEKPPGFAFTAGQCISMTLIDPPETDARGDTHSFSIASAPCERNLMVTTRMRDTAFKRTLKKLTRGQPIQIRGPFGSLTLREDAAGPAVFLAGGIGITPFRSILVQAAHQMQEQRLFLFYCNRRAEDAAFLDELKQLESANPNYKCTATLTKSRDSKREWDGEKGYINKTMLLKFIPYLQQPICYIAGTPGMVLSMREELKTAGVPNHHMRVEQFAGY